MSSARNSTDMDECGSAADLIAAYALNIATADEELSVGRHLLACPRCELEFDQYRETAAALALGSAALVVPPALKQRTVQAARASRRGRIPPLRVVREFGRRVSGGPATSAAVFAAMVVSAASLGWAINLQYQVTRISDEAQGLASKARGYDRVVHVLESTGLRVTYLVPEPSATTAGGTAFLDPDSGEGMLTVRNMPSVKQGHAWQMWYTRANVRTSGGLVWCNQDGTGYAVVSVPRDLATFESIGITDEPGPAGSPWPTSTRVLATSL